MAYEYISLPSYYCDSSIKTLNFFPPEFSIQVTMVRLTLLLLLFAIFSGGLAEEFNSPSIISTMDSSTIWAVTRSTFALNPLLREKLNMIARTILNATQLRLSDQEEWKRYEYKIKANHDEIDVERPWINRCDFKGTYLKTIGLIVVVNTDFYCTRLRPVDTEW